MKRRFSIPFMIPYHFLYIGVLLLVTVAVIWLYRDIETTFHTISEKFLEHQTEIVSEFSSNIENRLRQLVPDHPVRRLAKDEALRHHVEQILSLFNTRDFRYVYLLYMDDKGHLRYLADGSRDPEEKGFFGQRFDPDSDRWRKALESGGLVPVMQKDYTGLWLTFYYPLHCWKTPRTLLVFDVSAATYESFESMMHSVRDLLKTLSAILIVLLFSSILWAVLFYLQRKKNSIDPLTRLYNRNMLEQIASSIDLNHTSVILADIDHFKRINDRYGHDAGDHVLRFVAHELQRITRPEDIVIRYGGEEFLVFINEVTDREVVLAIASRMHRALSQRIVRYRDLEIPLSISAGVVPTPGEAMELTEAILHADKMLYVAKTAGRDRVVVYGEENDLPRPLLFREVAEAIERGELDFDYQPIVFADRPEICKYEVLARLRLSDGRVILPSEFIKAIRDTGVYRELSKLLITKAYAVIDARRVHLSINFDINDFLDETLFELIYDTFERRSELAVYLTIELLEENPVPDVENLVEKVNRLKSLGIEIAIDDFGKGYSGLNYILSFRPHILKVDREIVRQMEENEHVVPILRSIVAMARSIGLKTVAEGVENAETFEKLRELGFDCLQGYYIARPSDELVGPDGINFPSDGRAPLPHRP